MDERNFAKRRRARPRCSRRQRDASRRRWPVNPRVCTLFGAAVFGPGFGRLSEVVGVWLGGGLELFEFDLVAERFELALQAASSVFGRVAPVLPVGSEVS